MLTPHERVLQKDPKLRAVRWLHISEEEENILVSSFGHSWRSKEASASAFLKKKQKKRSDCLSDNFFTKERGWQNITNTFEEHLKIILRV